VKAGTPIKGCLTVETAARAWQAEAMLREARISEHTAPSSFDFAL